jgi:hypothetical protein
MLVLRPRVVRRYCFAMPTMKLPLTGWQRWEALYPHMILSLAAWSFKSLIQAGCNRCFKIMPSSMAYPKRGFPHTLTMLAAGLLESRNRFTKGWAGLTSPCPFKKIPITVSGSNQPGFIFTL